jgi:amphi-Trp domain-containing protein
VTFSAGDQTTTVSPPERSEFEIKVEREGPAGGSGELAIELEIEWPEDAEGAESGELEIE